MKLPQIKKKISSFLLGEEGHISKKVVVGLGVVIAGIAVQTARASHCQAQTPAGGCGGGCSGGGCAGGACGQSGSCGACGGGGCSGSCSGGCGAGGCAGCSGTCSGA